MVKGKEQVEQYNISEHLIPYGELDEHFQTSNLDLRNIERSKGLSDKEASETQVVHGKNVLSPPKGHSEIVKFLLKFTDLIIVGLLVATVLCFIVAGINRDNDIPFRSNMILGVFLFSVCNFFAILAYQQERTANNVLKNLKNMLAPMATVIRNGQEKQIEATDLVVGDIIKLSTGLKVAADCRVIQNKDLKVELSSLTGESDLVAAHIEKQSDLVHEARNILFMSTNIMQGAGLAVIVRTGDNTMIGNINKLTSSQKAAKSTLKVEINNFMIFIFSLAGTLAALFFTLGMTVGVRKFKDTYDIQTRVINSITSAFVAVLISNLPEGLPLTISMMLTIAAKKMGAVNILIKKIEIIETIGSTTFIASDKTGTLTLNQMSVQNIYVNRRTQSVANIKIPSRQSSFSDPIDRQSSFMNRTSISRGSIFNRRSSLTRSSKLERQSKNLDRVSQGLARLSINQLSILPSLSKESKSLGVNNLVPVGDGSYTYGDTSRQGLSRFSRISNKNINTTFNLNTLTRSANFANWTQCSPLAKLLVISAVQNNAKFVNNEVQREQNILTISERKIIGDATETALLRYCESIFPVNILRKMYQVVYEIPFSSINKWAISIAQNPAKKNEHIVFMKGAPEWLINKCTHYYYKESIGRKTYFTSFRRYCISHINVNNRTRLDWKALRYATDFQKENINPALLKSQELPLNDDFIEDFLEAQNNFSTLGERVLGFAYKQIPANQKQWYEDARNNNENGISSESYDQFSNGLVFMGLLSIMDPPRPSVFDAVKKCHSAGIRVAMVTGDNEVTAEAIARKVGIVSLYTKRELASELQISTDQIDDADDRYGAVILTGNQLKSKFTTDQAWDKILSKQQFVFARTTPQQKLEIVKQLQRAGNLVAVTGDGVNDSPALKQSDVGIAMGNPNASEVAREASDIILLDDQFGSIVNAVEEGRRVFDNLKKSICYTVTHLPVEVLPIFLNSAFGLPSALGGILTLTVDLIAEQGNATSMVFEKAEDNIMTRPPRNYKTDRLVPAKLIIYAYCIAAIAEMICCFMSYCTVFWYYKVPFNLLYESQFKGYFSQSDNNPIEGYSQFDPDLQAIIYRQCSAAWYVTLLLCQQCHIFHCKTRLASIYTHNIFDNWTTFFGVGFSLAIMFICVYVPWINSVLMFTFGPVGYCYLWFLPFLIFIHIYTETYKYFGRNNFRGFAFKYLVW